MQDTETQSQYGRAVITGIIALFLSALASAASAQESPYFVTYDHQMEEPGNFEVSLMPVFATPKEGHSSRAGSLEIEYGTRAWWTTELYLDGVSAPGEPSAFTGFRLENRFRLLMEEHRVNPVLYLEYESTNGADRIAREIVGFDSWHDFADPIADARQEKEHELETKLILSGNARGWNVAANAIAEKNLAGEPWEFGYAVGTSRPLALAARPGRCVACPENFSAGLEMYGGLGEQGHVTRADTAHYLAASIAWNLPNGITLKFSPARGLTANSLRSIVRFGISWEGSIR